MSADKSTVENRLWADGSLSASGDPVYTDRPLADDARKAGRLQMHQLLRAKSRRLAAGETTYLRRS